MRSATRSDCGTTSRRTSAVGVEQLRSPEWTQRWGTSSSIMSYARFNYVAQPGDGAALTPRFGPYDYYAIEWGYKPFGENITSDEEWPFLDAMAARQIDEPLLRFGGEDAVARYDPSVTSNVLGADLVAAGELGLKNVDRVVPLLIPATTPAGQGLLARGGDVLRAGCSPLPDGLGRGQDRWGSRRDALSRWPRRDPLPAGGAGAAAAGGALPHRQCLRHAHHAARPRCHGSHRARQRRRCAPGHQRAPAAAAADPRRVQPHGGSLGRQGRQARPTTVSTCSRTSTKACSASSPRTSPSSTPTGVNCSATTSPPCWSQTGTSPTPSRRSAASPATSPMKRAGRLGRRDGTAARAPGAAGGLRKLVAGRDRHAVPRRRRPAERDAWRSELGARGYRREDRRRPPQGEESGNLGPPPRPETRGRPRALMPREFARAHSLSA